MKGIQEPKPALHRLCSTFPIYCVMIQKIASTASRFLAHYDEGFIVDYSESVIQLAFRAALYFGINHRALSAIWKRLSMSVEDWTQCIDNWGEHRYDAAGAFLDFPMSSSCFDRWSLASRWFSSEQAHSGMSYLRLRRFTGSRGYATCGNTNRSTWEGLQPNMIIVCYQSSDRPVHFVGWREALSNEWKGPIREDSTGGSGYPDIHYPPLWASSSKSFELPY